MLYIKKKIFIKYLVDNNLDKPACLMKLSKGINICLTLLIQLPLFFL